MNKILIKRFLLLLVFLAQFHPLNNFAFAENEDKPQNVEDSSERPQIIYAKPELSDPWYPYNTRPNKDSDEAIAQYSAETLAKIPTLTNTNINWVPWSFKGIPRGDKQLYLLRDIIADKIVDKETGKTYNVMYHGTTSDLLDIFKPGASAIRFDVATNRVLGMGFYMSASVNEAKAYACNRFRERMATHPGLQPMLLVVGVEDNDIIKGKPSPEAHLSDDKTGAPLDPEIFFKRKIDLRNQMDNRFNQMSFFSNSAPFLKIFKIVLLPLGFGRSNWVQDYDGQTEDSATYKTNPNFRCD